MIDNQEMGSAQPTDAVSGDQGGESQGDGSASQEHSQASRGESRLLGEVKSLKAKLAETTAQFEQSQMQKLEAEGDKDKQIDFLKNENLGLKTKLKDRDEQFAFATLGSQVKTEAAKMGVQSPDDLLALMDLKSIPVDPTTFQGDTDSIRMVLEEQKKSRPFFFSKQAPQVHDVAQQNKVLNKPQKDVSQMSRDEINNMISEMANEKL